MAAAEVSNAPWTRKHDVPGTPAVPRATRIVYPASLEELIEICATRPPAERLHAAGSHWALSEAALSDATFIETHDPNDAFPAMGRTLRDVIPGCMNPHFIDVMANKQVPPYDDAHVEGRDGAPVDSGRREHPTYLVHVETGKRVYQLYAELDAGDEEPDSLARLLESRGNATYLGPWALHTLGGAGGQTVFGALTTGTHGGDIRLPPIVDAVAALHLVVDGGRHYWIEPSSQPEDVRLTDDALLMARYGGVGCRAGERCFEIIRDDAIFEAALISPGRFGAVYSIVMRAVRQYSLNEVRVLDDWQNVRGLVNDTGSSLYSGRFLQIGICPAPHSNSQRNRCGITRRSNAVGPASLQPAPGRAERRGDVVDPFDSRIGGPRFASAGNSITYPRDASDGTLLQRACADSSFVEGILDAVCEEIRRLLDENKVVAGGALAAIVVVAGIAGLVVLLVALAVILLLLLAFVAALKALTGDKPRLGQLLEELKDVLLGRADPLEQAAGVFVWQMIANRIFESEQKAIDHTAISYAVMDKHNFLDRSCNVNVDSIEVFFDARNAMLPAFVDALLAYEIRQEFEGRAMVGFISLRFMRNTRATLGMQRWTTSCAVEVAGLKDVRGTTDFIDYAITLALNRNFGGILHWGQRNPVRMDDVQARFGDPLRAPGGALGEWRGALARITDNGRLDGFSSDFTRRAGLEVVRPVIQSLGVDVQDPDVGQSVTVSWDCEANPPATQIALQLTDPSGLTVDVAPAPRVGEHRFVAGDPGRYGVRLTAALQLNGERRDDVRSLTVIAS